MSHDAEMDAAMSRIGVLRLRLEEADKALANLKAERDQLKADLEKSDGVVWTLSVENDRLKQSLRLQIEQNALAQVGFKMYQDNVDSGGLHKDRKDAIARLEAENARLKAEVERLENLVRYWSEKHKSVKEAFERASDRVKETQSEVERLTKAGDAMSDQLLCDYGDNSLTYAWHAAKGMQS